MNLAALVSRLRAGGDPLQMTAADALAVSRAEADRFPRRIAQLEPISRLKGETIRNMQRITACPWGGDIAF